MDLLEVHEKGLKAEITSNGWSPELSHKKDTLYYKECLLVWTKTVPIQGSDMRPMSVEYEKDVFAFFVERVELPHLTCNSKTILQEKISLIFNIRQFVFSKKFVE